MPQKLRKRHKPHARALKNLDERYERYADFIEMEPADFRGRWASKHPDATCAGDGVLGAGGVSEAASVGAAASAASSGGAGAPDAGGDGNAPCAGGGSEAAGVGTAASAASGGGASGAPGTTATGIEQDREVHLDLGCGKGFFAVEEARQRPDIEFVGLDCDRICIARAAQLAFENDVENLVFTLADAEDLCDLFAPGELSCIYLNFPTPHPRKKHASERLTHVDALIRYRDVLADDGRVMLRTDSPMLYEFSRMQFELAGYELVSEVSDLLAEHPKHVVSEYESRLVVKGARILACTAIPTRAPSRHEQAGEQSLYDYLPEDLDSLEYVPYGMEEGVTNLRNRRAKEKARRAAVRYMPSAGKPPSQGSPQ